MADTTDTQSDDTDRTVGGQVCQYIQMAKRHVQVVKILKMTGNTMSPRKAMNMSATGSTGKRVPAEPGVDTFGNATQMMNDISRIDALPPNTGRMILASIG